MWTSSNKYCKSSGLITKYLKPNMVCAFSSYNAPYSNMCSGDSGGPLVISKSLYDNTAIIYGIVSKKNSAWVCGQFKEHGTIFTRVTSHLKWIEDVRANIFNKV